ncbi:hypothetical protein ACJ72_08512, partial [Emergomyces africanus]
MNIMIPVVGRTSIELINDEPWRNGRKKFNAAFAPSNLATFMPHILDKTMEFLAVLDGHVELGDEFQLEEPVSSLLLTLLLGIAVLNIDFRSMQGPEKQSDIVRAFRLLLGTLPPTFCSDSWFANPKGRYRRVVLNKTLKTCLSSIVKDKFEIAHNNTGLNGNVIDRCVMALGLKHVNSLTPQVLEECIDAVKTFLFAGHDTTAIIVQWSIYELFRTPRALAAVRKELDEVLGLNADPKYIAKQLLEDSTKLQKLQYTSAVIKETLRLYPPAGTARMVPPGTGFKLDTKDGPVDVHGLSLYISHYILHRDPEVYGETAEVWVPERWLGRSSTSSEDYAASSIAKEDSSSAAGRESHRIPATAWRAFERGPRNCIGQELANLEIRTILAMVARRYEFTKVGLGSSSVLKEGKPVLNQYGQFETTKPLFGA